MSREAADSDLLDAAIRIGLVAYGIVHLLVAWLAFRLALGNDEGEASNQGALQTLAARPFGEVLIWAIALGMFFLVCWRLLEGAVVREQDDRKRRVQRVRSWGKAVLYGAVGYSALKVATGSGGSGDQSSSTTATLLDLPAGTWIVGAVALAILGYGANMIRRGLTAKHREHLTAEGSSGEAGAVYLWLGTYGYVAKGVAIGIVGGLFGYAAISHDADESGGLDEALHTVLQQPFGPFLLGAIALGIGSYGAFCFARARHLSQ